MIVTEEKRSCSARIYDELVERETLIEELSDRWLEDNDEDAYDELNNLALGIESKKVIKIELSTGGPADWVEVWCDDSQILEMYYHFSDWFDHAERKISETSSLWTWCESVIDNNIGYI